MHRLLAACSYLSAAACASAGLVYLFSPTGSDNTSIGPPGIVVAAAGILGAAALAASGAWQRLSVDEDRALPLVTLATLAGGYTLANVIGISFTELAGWRTPMWVGAPIGVATFMIAVTALLLNELRRRRTKQA
jgi:predicted MFS family arabinose efflux permease